MNNVPAPALLADTLTLVPYEAHDNRLRFSDLTEDDHALRVGLYHAKNLFAPDLSKVIVSGGITILGSLRVVLREIDGEVFDCAEISHCEGGIIEFRPKEGSMADCIGRNVIDSCRKLWVEALGLPPDIPCAVECEVDCGTLKLEISPLV